MELQTPLVLNPVDMDAGEVCETHPAFMPVRPSLSAIIPHQARLSIAAMCSKEPGMQNTPSLTRRIWYHYPYVMPATVLSPEPTHDTDPSSLRAEASAAASAT